MSYRGAEQNVTPTGRFAQETTDPLALQGIEDNCLNDSSEAHEQPKSYINLWGTTMSGLSAVYLPFIRGVTSGRRPLFFPCC